jgi:DNA-binding transcriptional ArsR family regulator
MLVRKTAEQIKKEILSNLEKGPRSIEQLRKDLGSNWSTINNYLEELKENLDVREIISGGNVKIYQRIYGDTYFNVPITQEQREKFKAIFSAILGEYRRRGEIPTKTKLAKSVVYVINALREKHGEQLPTIWYIYGMIPLMVSDLAQDYQTTYKFNIDGFETLVKGGVNVFFGKKTGEVQDLQYDHFKNELYILKKHIMEFLSSPDSNQEKITLSLIDFLIKLDSSQDIDLFYFTEEFNSFFGQLALLKKLEDGEIKRELLLTFDSIWNFVAINQTFDSLIKEGYSRTDLQEFYLGPHIETKKMIAKEKLSNLKSLYLNALPDKLPEVSISKGASEILEVFSDFN